jgi:hypothetical protein
MMTCAACRHHPQIMAQKTAASQANPDHPIHETDSPVIE